MQILRNLAAAAALACTAVLATANDPPFDSQSDGSDGALVVSANTTIDLRLAATGSWQDPSPTAGRGIYDPSIWAVVFKYESIDISAGTVNFINHASGAPVVWLVQGDVVIAEGALVSLNGAPTSGDTVYAVPGPGGFAGGLSWNSGFGPGGSNPGPSNTNSGGAGHAVGGGNNGGAAYGSLDIVPLMGGSGGAGRARAGGAGGGAILVASSSSINIQGQLTCLGGSGTASLGLSSGGGSGGAIRLVANHISLVGATRLAVGGGGPNGSSGRIRIEAYSTSIDTGAPSPNTFPYYTTAFPGDLFQDELTPNVRIAAINGNPITLDPVAGVQSIDATVKSTSTTVTIDIEAWNVEPGKIVQLKVHPATGAAFTVNSTPLVGSAVYSTASAQVTLNAAIPGDIVLRVLP